MPTREKRLDDLKIESYYVRALDELREATLFVMSSSRANRYRIFSKRLFRMAFMNTGERKIVSERKREDVLSSCGRCKR